MNSSNAMKKGPLVSGPELRGKDLNLRPLGYEPNELPLLHPAIQVLIICLFERSSTAQKLHEVRVNMKTKRGGISFRE